MNSVSIETESGEQRTIAFRDHAYRNLMELIVNELYEDIGACRGKAWCGTCHVAITRGQLVEQMERDETTTLGHLTNRTSTSRLACQITVDSSIDGMAFRILGDQ